MAALTLAAVGDISFCRADMTGLIADNGPEWYFAEVAASLADADLRFGNQESVFLPDDFPADKLNPRALKSDDAAWQCLASLKFDLLNQASNHVLDCGSVGLANTFKRICDAGAIPLGAAPEPDRARSMQIVERNGLRIGFLAYLEPCNWVLQGGSGKVSLFNLDWALADIARCGENVDTLIVSLHAGLEFQDAPSVPRVRDCRAMIEAGADIVLCHHPHVPQGVEFYEDGLIAYSLGNFCFPIGNYLGAVGGPNVYRSTVLKIDISEDGRPLEYRREDFRLVAETGRPEAIDAGQAREAAAHHDYLDELVADEDKLRQLWYESSLKYLKIHWQQIMDSTPEDFIEKCGWRILGLPENRNWTEGIMELAERRYADNACDDYEYDRPNCPFEGRGQ